MGLDTSHGCWHGAYSAFMRWRQKLAEVAGLPPLMLMEGFFERGSYHDPLKREADFLKSIDCIHAIDSMYAGLPIRWEALKSDPLHILLSHSDCDGDIHHQDCKPISDRLREILPLLPDSDGGGHIGAWREKTQAFIDGLVLAHERGESVDFH